MPEVQEAAGRTHRTERSSGYYVHLICSLLQSFFLYVLNNLFCGEHYRLFSFDFTVNLFVGLHGKQI